MTLLKNNNARVVSVRRIRRREGETDVHISDFSRSEQNTEHA